MWRHFAKQTQGHNVKYCFQFIRHHVSTEFRDVYVEYHSILLLTFCSVEYIDKCVLLKNNTVED